MIEGKLYLPPKPVQLSKTGLEYTFFHIKNLEYDICKVLCFGSLTKKVTNLLASKEEGTPIGVFGTYSGEDKGVKVIKAFDIDLNPNKKTSKRSEESKKFWAAFPEKRKQHIKEMFNRGFVLVKFGNEHRFIKKERCIKADGKWHETLEFIMDVLGGEQVTDIMRSEGLTLIVKGKISVDPVRVDKVLDELLDLAIGDYDGKIERYWYRSKERQQEQIRGKENESRRESIRLQEGSPEISRAETSGESREDKRLKTPSEVRTV